jgi:hypothetical protein
MVAAYNEVLRSSNFESSYDRFKNLSTECSEIDIGTIREAISALQLEADGVVKNVRRDPSATQKGFDFLIDGGPRGDETYLEIKNPVGSEIRKANGLPPSVTKQGKKLGIH